MACRLRPRLFLLRTHDSARIMDSLPRMVEEKNDQLVELYKQHEHAIASIRVALVEEFSDDERAHDTRASSSYTVYFKVN